MLAEDAMWKKVWRHAQVEQETVRQQRINAKKRVEKEKEAAEPGAGDIMQEAQIASQNNQQRDYKGGDIRPIIQVWNKKKRREEEKGGD